MDKSCHYYLCSDVCSDKFLIFRAVFSSSCEIKRCYIITDSLYNAMLILYDKLSSAFGRAYLDEHLLRLEFHDTYSC